MPCTNQSIAIFTVYIYLIITFCLHSGWLLIIIVYACEHSAFLNIHTIFIILMIGRLVGSWPLRSNSKPHSNLCIAFDSLLKLWWGRIKPLEVVCSAGPLPTHYVVHALGNSDSEEESNRWKLFAVLVMVVVASKSHKALRRRPLSHLDGVEEKKALKKLQLMKSIPFQICYAC